MQINSLLDRLDKVKATGASRWIACCPAHNDRNPSLAIRELDDSRILLKCFAGCETSAILSAIDLEFADLMPEGIGHHIPRERKPFNAGDVLKIAAFEARIAYLAAADIANGKPLTDCDRKRLLLAASRLQHCAEVANGLS